ncbi:MAG: hypothetical protein IT350_07725 [Deltaproteobacteria bacterium]|nr:hypothetical protein [Deltaproteobacteria bacterium]
MKIRPVSPLDNDALCRLSRETPMVGEVSVAIDRSPDYFAFYRLFGEGAFEVDEAQHREYRGGTWAAMVAEDDETGRGVVGVLMIAREEAWCGGARVVVARPEDGRVYGDFQRRGLAQKMAAEFLARYPASPADFTIFYILRGNEKAEGSARKGVEWFTGLPICEIELSQLSPYVPYRKSKHLRVETATTADRDEIVGHLAEHYSGMNLAPVLDGDTWDRMLAAHKGYGYEHIHVVRLFGRIVALAGLWDDWNVRRYVTTRWPLKVRLGIAAAHVIKSIVPAADPPRLNEPMRSVFLKHLWCSPGYEDHLVAMLKILMNRVRRTRRYHMVWGSFADNDPYRRLMEPFVRTSSVSRMYYVPGNTGMYVTPAQMRSRPIFADFSRV